jgi:hypothetical protein
VRQIVGSTVGLAIAGALFAGLLVLIGVDRTDLVLDGYLVYAGGLVALAAARIAGRAFPAPRGTVPDVLSQRPRRYPRPESLHAIEDDVALAQANEFDFHFRLRPVLAEIAAAGLATQAGIDFEHDPERARGRLSAATWEHIRPDRPRPESAGLRGIESGPLSEIVTELERILPP